MSVVGRSIIVGEAVAGTAGSVSGVNPANGEILSTIFSLVDAAGVGAAAGVAAGAFDEYRATTPTQRAEFLRKIADELDRRRDEIVGRAILESGLSSARITVEHARTAGHLCKFADELMLGAHQDVHIDHALPGRKPAACPDIRQRQISLGPIAVFSASNFPLAFSTAGGDTASSLAAGCTVIVKAHNSHPGTAELTGQAIASAVAACHLPAGTFSLLFGTGNSIGQALAGHPAIKAIAFTGSRACGTALMRIAAERPEPVPVFAEMSSINPVVLLPGALDSNLDAIAHGFVESLTSGAGQVRTNPGLVFVEASWTDRVVDAFDEIVTQSVGQTRLSERIVGSYNDGISRLRGRGTESVAHGKAGGGRNAPAPAVFRASATDLAATPDLQHEVSGSAALYVTHRDTAELVTSLEQIGGQLTVSLHAIPADHDAVRVLLPVLERKAGRVLCNGWPTGVEVTDAMIHGGPYPATSDSRTTPVGTLAISRFQRPVTYQGVPDALLPDAVQDSNRWQLPRRIVLP